MALWDVLIGIGGDTSHYEKKLRNAKLTTKKTTQAISSAWKTAMKAAVLFAGAGGLGYVIKKNIELADSIGKTASKIGVTTDELQEYRYAAKIANVEQSQLDMGLQRFSRRVAEAAMGTGELKNVAEQYNVQLRDSDGQMRANSEILADFADIIKNAESEQERLRIAFKLFDSEGAALVNMLKNGGEALNEMRAKARELGIVLDKDLIKDAEKVSDQFATLSEIMQKQVMASVVNLTPTLVVLTNNMTDLAESVGKAIDGFNIFFGIGEKAELQKQLHDLVKDLNSIEEEISRIEEKEKGLEKNCTSFLH